MSGGGRGVRQDREVARAGRGGGPHSQAALETSRNLAFGDRLPSARLCVCQSAASSPMRSILGRQQFVEIGRGPRRDAVATWSRRRRRVPKKGAGSITN